MSNLGEALWQRAFEEGFKQGYKQGFELGYQQGLEQARETEELLCICNVMKAAKCPAKQAMDALKIPESRQEKYLAMLNA